MFSLKLNTYEYLYLATATHNFKWVKKMTWRAKGEQ